MKNDGTNKILETYNTGKNTQEKEEEKNMSIKQMCTYCTQTGVTTITQWNRQKERKTEKLYLLPTDTPPPPPPTSLFSGSTNFFFFQCEYFRSLSLSLSFSLSRYHHQCLVCMFLKLSCLYLNTLCSCYYHIYQGKNFFE